MSGLINYSKIKKIIYTEKSSLQSSLSKYHFEVDVSCSRNQVASLIKNMFNVNVKAVNIINCKSKTRRFSGIIGKTNAYKKAIVTLENGQVINITE